MFKSLYYFWYNNTDTPAINFKLNLWFFINLRLFKVKLTNYLILFISSLNGFKIKELKIFYKDYNFEIFFFKNILFLLLFLPLLLLFI